MDLLDLVRIGLRRWYVAVPAALVVVLAAFAGRASVELTYESTGSLLLFAPRESDVSRNRLLGFNSLAVPAAVSARVVGDAATREKLRDLGASPDYEVGLDPGNPAPLVIAIATGGIEQAPRTVGLVLAEVAADLEERQRALGAPPETWITTEVVTPPTEPVPQNGSRTRAFLAVLVVGSGLAALVTIIADRIMEGRSRRRSPAGAELGPATSETAGAGAGPAPTPVPPQPHATPRAPEAARPAPSPGPPAARDHAPAAEAPAARAPAARDHAPAASSSGPAPAGPARRGSDDGPRADAPPSPPGPTAWTAPGSRTAPADAAATPRPAEEQPSAAPYPLRRPHPSLGPGSADDSNRENSAQGRKSGTE